MARKTNRTKARARNIESKRIATRLARPGGAYVTTRGRGKNVTGLLTSMGTQRSRIQLGRRGFPSTTVATRGGFRQATRGEATRASRADTVATRSQRSAVGLSTFSRRSARAQRHAKVGLHTRSGLFGSGGPLNTKARRQRAVHELTRGRSKVSRQSISRHANLGSLFNRLHPRAKNGRFIRK